MELPIVGCRLDANGLRLQRDRYRQLGLSAEAIEREEGTLNVRFATGLDADLLRETIAIETDCCPFFRFDYQPHSRLLRIGVERADQAPALDALAHALGAGEGR